MTTPRRLARIETELPEPTTAPRDLAREMIELAYARDVGLFTNEGETGPALTSEPPDGWRHTRDHDHTGTCRKCWERAYLRCSLFASYVRQLLTEVPEAVALGLQEPPVWLSQVDAEHGWAELDSCMTWECAVDLIADRGAPWDTP